MYIGLPGPISVALMQACKSILQKRLFDGVSEIFFVCFVFLSTLSLPNNVLCFQANYNFHPKNVEFGFLQTPDVNCLSQKGYSKNILTSGLLVFL